MQIVSIFDMPSFGLERIFKETLIAELKQYTSKSYMPSAHGATKCNPVPKRIKAMENIILNKCDDVLVENGYYTNTPYDGVVWFYGNFQDVEVIVNLQTYDAWVRSVYPEWSWEEWVDQRLPVDLLVIQEVLRNTT